MYLTLSGGSTFSVALPNERATRALVREIGDALEPGDLITLSGDLGAGKTTFARALIRYLAGNDAIEVPSPTFTLMQTYQLPHMPLVHADLYRLTGAADLAELGFEDLPEDAVVLMEWPDRAAGHLPPDRLDIAFTLAPQHGLTYRDARLTGHGKFARRAERIGAVRRFLDRAGFRQAERWRLPGDASTRSYERLSLDRHTYMLMNAPRRTDGPPVRHGKPYSAIAHLAEDVTPFVALANGLRERGLSAPAIIQADLEAGLVILEDLGNELVVGGNPPAPIDERYGAAVDVLVTLHGESLPEKLPLPGGGEYKVPRYDIDAFLIECELLLDWYFPKTGAPISETKRIEYLHLWRDILQPALESPPTWVLRDYHSPNLLWLPARQGAARVGLLDFQDAQIGPAAYDLASLLHDARVDVPEMLEITLLSRYTRARRAAQPGFDAAAFAQLYATLAAQRASKILGIFARLDRRDGKPQYLAHIPRVWNYLQRALAHPALGQLKTWYAANVPAPDSE